MPRSVASVLGEADDFEATLREEGCIGVLVTGRGAFHARLTQIGLHHLGLVAVEERLARIAFFTVPAGMVLAVFALGGSTSPGWGGIAIQGSEIVTLGPGEGLHSLTNGPALWGGLRIAERELLDYGREAGAGFGVPRGIARWQPPRAAAQELRELYHAAIRTAARRPELFADAVGTHGLEQQMVDALIECLSVLPAQEEPAAARDRCLLARFEGLLLTGAVGSLAEICAAGGVSPRRLRECCIRHFGMSAADYRQRRAMQQVNRDLRRGNVASSTVALIAKRHGFKVMGRFITTYRALYGESPSATLRSSYGVGPINLGRPR